MAEGQLRQIAEGQPSQEENYDRKAARKIGNYMSEGQLS